MNTTQLWLTSSLLGPTSLQHPSSMKQRKILSPEVGWSFSVYCYLQSWPWPLNCDTVFSKHLWCIQLQFYLGHSMLYSTTTNSLQQTQSTLRSNGSTLITVYAVILLLHKSQQPLTLGVPSHILCALAFILAILRNSTFACFSSILIWSVFEKGLLPW